MTNEENAAANAASDDFARTGLAVRRAGYSPVPITPGLKSPPIPHFSDYCTEPASFDQIAAWGTTYSDHGLGVCLGFGGLICIKVDAGTPELSREVADYVVSKLKATPLIRSGAQGSLALFYRLVGGDHSRLRDVELRGTVNGTVSFWQDQMQIIAFGRHSQTGEAYGWLEGSPLDTPSADIPGITRKALIRAHKGVKGRFGRRDGVALPTDLEPIARDKHTGKVISGHETFLRQIAYNRLHRFFNVYSEATLTALKVAEMSQMIADQFDEGSTSAPNKLTKAKKAHAIIMQMINAAGSNPRAFFAAPTRDEFVTVYTDAEDPEGSLYNPVPVGRARELVRETIDGFLNNAMAINLERQEYARLTALSALPHSRLQPPIFWNSYHRRALRVTTGVGKSTAMRAALLDYLQQAEGFCSGLAEGDTFWRVLVLVPTHALAREMVADFETVFDGTSFAVAHAAGRHAEHPDRLGELESSGGHKVGYCDESQSGRARALTAKGVHNEQIDDTVCRNCPLIETCSYWTQKEPVKNANVVVSSHQYLTSGIPDFFGEGFGLVIVDEDCSGVARIEDAEREIHLDELGAGLHEFPVRVKGEDGISRPSLDLGIELQELEAKLARWLSTHPTSGPIDLAGCTLNEEELQRAKSLNWARLAQGVVEDEALASFPARSFIAKRCNLLDAVIRAKSPADGRHFGHYGARMEGNVVRVLMTKRTHKDFSKTPLLTLDASYSEARAGEFLYPTAMLAEVEASAPHRHVTQFTGRYGMSRIYSEENVARIVAEVKALGSVNGVFITTKKARPVFEAAFALAGLGDVTLLHHGALAGLDTFGSVDWLVIAGFQRASKEALVQECRDRGHEPIEGQRKVYVYDPKPGGGKSVRAVRQYADPMMQGLCASIQIACLAQAEGRARAVNRTQGQPVKTLVFGAPTCAMPFPVDEIIDRRPGDPTGDIHFDTLMHVIPEGLLPLSAPMLVPLFNRNGTYSGGLRKAERVLLTLRSEVDLWAGGSLEKYLKILTGKNWKIFEKKGSVKTEKPFLFLMRSDAGKADIAKMGAYVQLAEERNAMLKKRS